jgi:hypothetical protein
MKIITLVFGGLFCCVFVGLATISVYKIFSSTSQLVVKENSIVNQVPISQEEIVTSTPTNEQKQASVPRILTYKNQQLGFEFYYPETFYVEVKGGTSVGSTVVTLVELSKRTSDGYMISGGFIDFHIIAKEKATDTLQRLRRDYDLAQRQREEECKSESSDEAFNMCAYYGGGVNFTTSTLQSVETVERHFVGEGSGEITILIPSKGFSISYDSVFVPSDVEFILQSIRFFDKDRVISDKKIGIAFVCPAFWICENIGTSYFNTVGGETEKYSLRGQNDQYLGMDVAKITAEKKKEVIKWDEDYFAKQTKDYGLQVNAYSFLSTEKFKVDVYEYGYKDQSKTVLLFIPEQELAIALNTHNMVIDQEYIKALFNTSGIK